MDVPTEFFSKVLSRGWVTDGVGNVTTTSSQRFPFGTAIVLAVDGTVESIPFNTDPSLDHTTTTLSDTLSVPFEPLRVPFDPLRVRHAHAHTHTHAHT